MLCAALYWARHAVGTENLITSNLFPVRRKLMFSKGYFPSGGGCNVCVVIKGSRGFGVVGWCRQRLAKLVIRVVVGEVRRRRSLRSKVIKKIRLPKGNLIKSDSVKREVLLIYNKAVLIFVEPWCLFNE